MQRYELIPSKNDEIKEQIPIAIVVLRMNCNKPSDVTKQEIVEKVRDQIGSVANLKTVVFVDRLPKTRSGKILRKVIRLIAIGSSDWQIPPTVEDPEAVDHVADCLLAEKFPVTFPSHHL